MSRSRDTADQVNRIDSSAADATAITIDSSENVGIGTSSPNVYSGYTSLTLDHATNGGIIDIERGGNLIGEMFAFDSNTFALSAVGSRAINFSTNSLERMRIDSSGNVGIGTSSPSTFNSTGGKLAVSSGAGNVAALFSDTTYYTLGIKHTGTGSEAVGMFGGTSGSGLALMSNNTEAMRIDNSGNVGIGATGSMTSGAGWLPRLVLEETSGSPALILKGLSSQQASIGSSNGLYLDSLGSTTGSNNRIIFRVASANSSYTSTEAMRIHSTSMVTKPLQPAFNVTGSAAYVSRSDPIQWSAVTFNIGNHYSTSTHKFTAPLAGRYVFTVHGLKEGTETSGSGLGIKVNGTAVARVYLDPGGRSRSVSTVVSLSANDVVHAFPEGDMIYYLGLGYGVFSGYFLG